MNRLTVILLTTLMAAIVAMGCTSGAGNNGNPVLPDASINLTGNSDHNCQSQTHLWGYWDIYIDIETQTATATLDRSVMFTANVVNFLNGNPMGLSFTINDTPFGSDYIDVDIDVGITHPFAGMPQYNGYDVRGVFMGDGSATLTTSGVVYPMLGEDQFMFPDPDGGNGAPDGYTRWFNLPEFSTGGMPLFQYTQGNLATPGFAGTATLCPYKYFADSLGTNEDLWDWLTTHTSDHGIFTSGATNERNYYLRFPNDKEVVYGYAVIANWEGEDLEYHPSNTIEAIGCDIVDSSTLFYVDPTNNGGDLILDISLFGWEYQPSTIHIESTVLSAASSFDPATVATEGDDHYSTYHVEIPADAVAGIDGNELWVIAQYNGFDYSNEFGVPNNADEDELAAYFRHDLTVTGEPECPDPTVSGIDPDYFLTGWQFGDLTITGTNLVDGPSLAALLRKDGESDIAGTDVQHVDNTTITAKFDLTGAADGFWDVVVTNGCGNEAMGVELLEVYSCGSISGFTSAYDVVISTGWPHDVYGGYVGMAGTQTGTPYAIGATREQNELGATRVGVGIVAPAQFYSDTTGVGNINRDIVCDSQNNVYFTDSTDYSRLRYFPFDETTGFGAAAEFGTIETGWRIWRITIDVNDNPVILAHSTSDNEMCVYHWNSGTSNWDITDVPSEVVAGGWSQVGDFDWNPLMQHYVIVKRITNNQSNLYASDTDGNLVATIEDIFNGINFTALPGIYIDVNDPTCRIVTWGGWTSYGNIASPFTRMNAAYDERTTTSINVGNVTGQLNITGPRGQVAMGSNRLIVGAHYINVWAKVPLPGDW